MEANPKGLWKFRITNREECGLIIARETDKGTEHYVVKVPNHSPTDDDYMIYLSDVQNVEAVLSPGESVAGFMHTHLQKHKLDPTDDDLDGAENFPGVNHLIYKPSTGETVWYGVVEEVAPTVT